MTSDLLFYISVYSILFFSSECLCPLNGSIGQKSVSEIECKRQKERGKICVMWKLNHRSVNSLCSRNYILIFVQSRSIKHIQRSPLSPVWLTVFWIAHSHTTDILLFLQYVLYRMHGTRRCIQFKDWHECSRCSLFLDYYLIRLT